MSQKSTYTITCPECSAEQTVELMESINLATDPDLRDLLMQNRINHVVCDACGFEFRVDKTMVYNDPIRSFMIYCVPEADAEEAVVSRIVQEAMTRASADLPEDVTPPTIHLSLSRTELIERIFVLEKDMDARIVEYIKYSIYTRNQDQIDPEQKTLLFDAEDSTDEHLLFVVQDVESNELQQVLQYSRAGYDALTEMFDQDEETANLLELFPGPYINARHAFLRETRDVLEADGDDLED